MQHVKVKYSEKPHLKEGAGWFSRWWYRRRVKHDNRQYNHYDQQRRTVTLRFLSLLGIAAAILIYSMVMPRPSSTVSTKLNQEMAFGNQGTNVALTKKIFNDETGLLELHFKFTGNVDDSITTGINMKRFKLSFAGDRYIQNGQSEYHIVATSPNTMVVQFEKLKTNFQDVRVSFADKTIDTESIKTAANDDESATNKQAKASDQLATIIINNDDKLPTNQQRKVLSKKQLVVAQTRTNIQEHEHNIKENRAAIKEWQVAIKEQTENVRATRQQMQDMTDKERSQANETIASYESKMTDLKKNISDAKNDIRSEKDKIKHLEKQKTKQQHGQLNVPKLAQ